MIYLGAVVAIVNGVRLMMSDEETDEEATPGQKIVAEAEETPETSE
jgi:hypothetical protein